MLQPDSHRAAFDERKKLSTVTLEVVRSTAADGTLLEMRFVADIGVWVDEPVTV